jgi:hypothetical protein
MFEYGNPESVSGKKEKESKYVAHVVSVPQYVSFITTSCSDMVCAANNLVRVVVLKQGQVTQFETFHHQMVEWCACISLSWRVSSPEIAPVVIRLVFSLPSCFKSSQIVFGHRLLKILLVERLLKGEKKIR